MPPRVWLFRNSACSNHHVPLGTGYCGSWSLHATTQARLLYWEWACSHGSLDPDLAVCRIRCALPTSYMVQLTHFIRKEVDGDHARHHYYCFIWLCSEGTANPHDHQPINRIHLLPSLRVIKRFANTGDERSRIDRATPVRTISDSVLIHQYPATLLQMQRWHWPRFGICTVYTPWN